MGELFRHDPVSARSVQSVTHKQYLHQNVYILTSVCFYVAVALYTVMGFIQMTIWARGKHRAYSREFKDYPSLRMAIIPLIL